MTRAPGRLIRPVLLLAGVAWFAACDRSETTAPERLQAAASGGGGGLSVAATAPAYGRQGDVGLAVTITGSGFKPGAQASWKLDGGPTADIIVNSTQYVSSTQLIATIDIGSTADLTFYDVAVTQTGRKGIGTESATGTDLFEVTQAVPIAGAGDLRGVNDNGEITGNGGPIYWSSSSGLLLVDTAHAGFAISPLGNAISANNMPRLYTRAGAVGTPWQVTLLPVDASATDGGAHALLADPATGQVVLIAGQVMLPAPKNKTITQPRLWVRQTVTSSWQLVALATGSNTQGTIRQLSRDSVAVGMLGPRSGSGYPGGSNQAAAWQPDGLGGWALVTLAPVPSGAQGINSAGTLIVGGAGGVAVYWERLPGGGWSAPISLPGGCSNARAVDDSRRIAIDGCPSGKPTASQAAVLVPPYSASTMIHLGGLGGQSAVEAMSPSGNWIVGGPGQGVYWRPF